MVFARYQTDGAGGDAVVVVRTASRRTVCARHPIGNRFGGRYNGGVFGRYSAGGGPKRRFVYVI